MSLAKYLEQQNFSRKYFNKLPPLSISTMTLSDANELAESMSAAWSPENLTCDGELSRAEVQRKARMLRQAAYELMIQFPDLTIPEWSEDLFEARATERASFIVGQTVAVNHVKLGGRVQGRVLKVNRVKCRVEFAQGTFNVPFSMMEKV